MPYYYINLVLITIYALLFSTIKLRNGKSEVFFLFVSFIQIVFFRAFVNPETVPDLSDWNGYVTEFQNIAGDDLNSFWYYLITARYEPLYLLFVKGCSLISSNYHFYLALTACASALPVFFTIKKYSVNVYLSVLLYVLFFFSISSYVVRQFISVGILLLSYDSIVNKKLPKFLLITIISTLFHYSSIIWIFFYFLYWYIRNSKRAFFVCIVFVCFVALLSSYIEMAISSIDYYSNYAEEKQSYKMGLIHVFFILCYLYALGKHSLDEGINRIILISLLFGTVGLLMANYAERFYTCFKYVDFLAIPLTLLYLRKKNLGFIYITIVLILCFALFMVDEVNDTASFLF